jgi:hypothetical protein
MRAVSFFGPGEGTEGAFGVGLTAGTAPADAALAVAGVSGGEAGGGATTPPATGGEGAFGGKNGGGDTGLFGAGGNGVCARGGRGTVDVPGVGTGLACGRGAFRVSGVTPFEGGRVGKFIRTVSREPGAGPGDCAPGRGVKVMRTVSFLGSFGSAMKRRESLPKVA